MDAGWENLTRAELRVVELVAEGYSNPDIAARLNLSRHTVESHLKSVFSKLAISSRTQLAVLATKRFAGTDLPNESL
ncbi:MAG TPA: helix-turn-helix transcriptional regulator [Actinomycetota bacterium]|nr:helix-turn-helix transcriptional regulator [Actinomycetota bacterium]